MKTLLIKAAKICLYVIAGSYFITNIMILGICISNYIKEMIQYYN